MQIHIYAFKNVQVFKNDGVILINEPETSFMLKFIQVVLDDESWSLADKVFQKLKNYLIQKIRGFQIQQ